MKKRLMAILTVIMLVMSCLCIVACTDKQGDKSGSDEEPHTHSYEKGWSYNSEYHWHKATCEHENEVSDRGKHDYGSDNICDVCGYEKENEKPPVEHEHEMTKHAAKDATCTEDGNEEYYECNKCKNIYLDEEGNEATDIDSVTRKATGHKASETPEADGTHHWYNCSVCGKEIEETKEEHIAEAEYDSDDTHHWHNCSMCGEKIEKTEKVHRAQEEYTSDGTQHWHECECGKVMDEKTEHTAEKEYDSDDVHHWHNCSVCGEKINETEEEHRAQEEYTSDDTQHWHECECGKVMDERGEHTYGEEWEKDDFQHWHNCSVCGKEADRDTHDFDEGNKCVGCGYKRVSVGLSYKLNEDNQSYSVIGKGECSDSDIVIPAMHEDKPVTSIGKEAFYYVRGLFSIEIPSSVTRIDFNAFNSCDNLERVYINDIAAWCNIDFDLEYANPLCYGAKLYVAGKEATELEIPKEVTEIKAYAFRKCSNIQTVTFEKESNLQSIGTHAFFDCKNLQNMEIPSSVMYIEKEVFSGCDTLQYNKEGNIKYLGNKENGYVALIGLDSFEVSYSINADTKVIASEACNVTSLQTIEIPASVKSIGEDAFAKCSDLQGVYYKGDITSWCNIEFKSYTSNPLYGNTKLYIGGKEVTTFEISREMTEIKAYAFSGYGYLQTITAGTESKLQRIGENAFKDCNKLQSIEIPSSVTSIGESVFDGCDIKTVYYKGSTASWCNIEFAENYSNPLHYEAKLYIEGKEVTNLNISKEMTEIKAYAFLGYDYLQTVTFEKGSKLQCIGEYAFYECTALKEVHIDDLTAWCNIEFKDSYSNPLCYGAKLYIGDREVTDLVIPNDLTEIRDYTFHNCAGLRTVTFEKGSKLQRIGEARSFFPMSKKCI